MDDDSDWATDMARDNHSPTKIREGLLWIAHEEFLFTIEDNDKDQMIKFMKEDGVDPGSFMIRGKQRIGPPPSGDTWDVD